MNTILGNHQASLSEIFSSRQGEGPYVGEYMTFVRFGHCALSCQWCDSPESLDHSGIYKIETPPRSEAFTEFSNPISIAKLNEHLADFEDEFLSVTGGEPLEQADFLAQWLPSQFDKRILLETSGILTKALLKVIHTIDIVSMDLKLPSSTGMKAYWKEHKAFLETCVQAKKEVYAKMIVTESTSNRDIEEAIRLINTTSRRMPVIIQPVSETESFASGITENRLHSIERLCQAYLPDVQIIPQMHKEWNIL